MKNNEKIIELLVDKKYPLSAKYDPMMVFENKMGSPSLWLVESLSKKMNLKPGMRVLDLGCGKGMTSIFLAKEYGVTVFALDLWINPDENWERVRAAGVEDKVFPLRGDVHSLPFAKNFFDAIIAVNSYQFFGTSDTFFADYLSDILRPDGEFGLVIWGPKEEFAGDAPSDFDDVWWPDFYYFHSLAWWKRNLNRTRLFSKIEGDDLDGDGVRVSQIWAEIMDKTDPMHTSGFMRWNRIIAKRNASSSDDHRMW